MVRARAYGEERLCEECGRPIDKGRENQLLCRRCEDELERQKRRGRRLRDNRRHSHREEDEEGW
jgi:predicted amidophosphoribosyltransferase